MERLFFLKLPVWSALLILVFIGIGVIFFGSIVKDETASRENSSLQPSWSWVGVAAYELSSIPDTAKILMDSGGALHASNYKRFGDKIGWVTYDDSEDISGYLLFSRIDPVKEYTTVELIDLSDKSVVHTWEPDPEVLLKDVERTSNIVRYTQWHRGRFRAMHPLLLEDGSLVMHGQFSPLLKLDHCGERLWIQAGANFHHSLNVDADGNFWAPTIIEPSEIFRDPQVRDDGLGHVSADGELISNTSMAEIFERKGQAHLVVQAHSFSNDPLHMNDIQPALEDGPYWKKGDLFISMRKKSLIALYRPSTDEIVWQKAGPWLVQHDIDIVNDHVISIFDNAVKNRGKGGFIEESSDIAFYDFRTDEVTFPFRETSREARILAITNGLNELTESGHQIIEEDTSGRLLIYNSAGKLVEEFYNKATSDGPAWRMSWSRYIPQAMGEKIVANLRKAPTCN
ncbi:arylsulfotransferase family protein [Ruegeria lacuscaerulensis]|uniref:arylsulfotransferase family protein n=1 Tax=Ruegeria lacuscaerulensis TaxID=55218 RepID=UPI001481D0FF|nr:arylsulfotransferase family protein [Ruegeria lacuscaerulensis]